MASSSKLITASNLSFIFFAVKYASFELNRNLVSQ